MTRLPPWQIDTVGAAGGNALVYNAATDAYEPATVSGGGGSTSSQAEYTLAVSTGSSTGAISLGTPTIDSTHSTDSSIATPGSAATFTIGTAGVYALSAFLPLSSQPSGRNFQYILRGGTEIARATLAPGVSEDAWTITAAGVYVAAGTVITFGFFKQNSSPAVTATMRFFIARS